MRVLVTGAAGRVARLLRPELAGVFDTLILADRRPPEPAYPEEAALPLDIADPEAVVAATGAVDAVLHLAAIATEAPFDAVLAANVAGTYHVLEAARQAGVGRVVVASSNHTVGLYPDGDELDAASWPHPDSFYGWSKVAGEFLGQLYADKFGVSNVQLRIGSATPAPTDRRHLRTWISPRDLAQLCRLSLTVPGLAYGVFYGISGNRDARWDDSAAERLGYRPVDDAAAYADRLKAAPEGALGQAYHGGWFVDAGHPDDGPADA